jgi:NAD(P)-dependent dehydrogenase (short-subunit alcohol dehydrogenase family)
VDLSGMVAVVTGASRRSGRLIAPVLGELGATVYVTGSSVRGAPSGEIARARSRTTNERFSKRGDAQLIERRVTKMEIASHETCVSQDGTTIAFDRYTAGPEAALAAALERYHLYHATRAGLLRTVGRGDEARAANRRVLELTANPAEQAVLRRRIDWGDDAG